MRRLTLVLGIAGAVLLAALGVTGGGTASAASSVNITSAYIPQPTTPGTTVAYLDIRNNGHADRLIAVHTSVGGTVQLRAAGARHAGKDITLRLTFADAGTITVLALVTNPQSGGGSYFLN